MSGPIEPKYPIEISAFFDLPTLFGAQFTEYPSAPAKGQDDDNGISQTVRYRSVGANLRLRPVSLQDEKGILFSPYLTFGFSRSTPWMRREEGGDLTAIPDLSFLTFDPGIGGLTAVRLGEGSHVGVTYALLVSAYTAAKPKDCPEDQIDRYGNCEDTSPGRKGGIPVPVDLPLFPTKGPHLTGRFGGELSLKLIGKEKGLRFIVSSGVFIRQIKVEDNVDADKVHLVSGDLALGLSVSF